MNDSSRDAQKWGFQRNFFWVWENFDQILYILEKMLFFALQKVTLWRSKSGPHPNTLRKKYTALNTLL